MSLQKVKGNNFNFIQGGGEMGEITRSVDWNATTLGTPDKWSPSLRTTLGILLHSAFPMFLFWGKQLTCFYNDAFRPSLGASGKHPAVGKNGREVWEEIWEFIKPLIDQVISTGEPVWFEDQLLPIFRNGKMEDVYWTFSYSPVYDDDGEINGVFVTCTETTRKVQTIQKLIETENHFKNLIREATVGIVVLIGEEMIVEVANDAYGKLINYNHLELIGKPLFDIIPESEPYFRHLLENVRTSGEPYYLYDHPYFILTNEVKKEGFLNIVYQPYRKGDGKIEGVMALCHDVTEQVLARKKVERNELRVRALVENVPFPIGVYIGAEMTIELANQTILDIWGKGNDVIGKRYTEILPELESQEIFGQLQNVFTQGTPFHARNQRVDLVAQGKTHTYYFNYSFTPLYDLEGQIYGVMNTAADVTELNLAKIKVEESGKNLRNIIVKAPVAMCIFTGPQFVVEIANERMIELWGTSFSNVMNKPIFEGLPEAKNQGFEQMLTGVFTTGEAASAQGAPVVLPRNNRPEMVYVNYLFEAYREANNEISGIIAVATDVTDQVIARKQIEKVVAERTKELAEANNNLQKSNAELAQFAYIASHDLQEPVRKVSTFIQMLENSLSEVDERSLNYLGKIKKSSARMLVLIRDVLAYSQLSRETEILKVVDLESVISDIQYDLELLIEQKGAEITQNGLPGIEGIPLQLSQLFANLISNALKFSRTDIKPIINITSSVFESEISTGYFIPDPGRRYYHLRVKDNGIGFEQQHAEQIFSIFQRLHGKQQYEGTGIGLALCRKIVQNHHGHIYADSTKGNGTTFHVILPEKQISNDN